MRAFLILILCLCGCMSHGQNTVIYDKKGNKKIVQDDAIEIILLDKRVSYKDVGKTWEKYITFKDLDRVETETSVFRSVRLDNRKKDEGFYVLAENADHICLVRAIVVVSSGRRFSSSMTYYSLFITDKQYHTIESLEFNSLPKNIESASGIVSLIRKYFGNCPGLTERLNALAGPYESQLNLITSPVYNDCK